MNNTVGIKISEEEFLRILKDLDVIIVSLDRIGSQCAHLTDAERDKMISNFLVDWKVFEKLANMRARLSASIDEAQMNRLIDKIENETPESEYWKMAKNALR